MEKFLFTDFLLSNVPLTEVQLRMLFQKSRILKVDKGEVLLSAGDTCKHRFFIEKGAVREFYVDEHGKEHLLVFAVEGWFVVNVDSVFFDHPSRYFIQAIEPTKVLLIDEEQVQALSLQSPEFDHFNKQLIYEHIQHLQHRITSLQSDGAEIRYQHFIKAYPELLLRIPQAYIASYLGITPESLSRIRRQLVQQARQK